MLLNVMPSEGRLEHIAPRCFDERSEVEHLLLNVMPSEARLEHSLLDVNVMPSEARLEHLLLDVMLSEARLEHSLLDVRKFFSNIKKMLENFLEKKN